MCSVSSLPWEYILVRSSPNKWGLPWKLSRRKWSHGRLDICIFIKIFYALDFLILTKACSLDVKHYPINQFSNSALFIPSMLYQWYWIMIVWIINVVLKLKLHMIYGWSTSEKDTLSDVRNPIVRKLTIGNIN